MATNAAQVPMMREPSGMSSPASWSGYPSPSMRSWVERTSPDTFASAGADDRIRSPMSGWRRTKLHSSSFSGPGLSRI